MLSRLRAVSSARMSLFVAVSVAVALAAVTVPTAAAADAQSTVRIKVLSERADLVSGSDALVQLVTSPARLEPRLTVRLNGRDISGSFALRASKVDEGLVTGLRLGENELVATLPDGSGARMTITDHPIGGPVFSGPQIQPWLCDTTASGTDLPGLGAPVDAQCDTATVYGYYYLPAGALGGFQQYNPADPPPTAAIATTTTQTGQTLPFIVRTEEGVEDRGIYSIAVLWHPGRAWTPWAPQPQWNGKLELMFGGGTAPSHEQGAPSSVMDAYALGKGFMVASSGLMTSGEDANAVVAAESVAMLREHIVDEYGPVRYAIGSGCSGGGLLQDMIAAQYPGLVNGLLVSCNFLDYWTTAPEVLDCHLLDNYYANNPSEAASALYVMGYEDPSDCEAWDQAFAPVETPSRASNCKLPSSEVYSATTNPTGVRCDLQDYQENIFGQRSPAEWGPVEKQIGHGFAPSPYDNVGIEYGLSALLKGQITPAEFADLNAKIGGVDIDNNYQAVRTATDDAALKIAYRSGQVTDAHYLAQVPIIDLRGSINSDNIHTPVHSLILRARLDAANHTHANQIIWTFPVAAPLAEGNAPPQGIENQALDLMDRWLSAVDSDRQRWPSAVDSDDPGRSLAARVIADKPSDARDACFVGQPADEEITDSRVCKTLYPVYSDPRLVAGMPLASTILKCQLKPLTTSDFPASIRFTAAEWTELQQAFPTGVCDWSKPGVEQQPATVWNSYADGPGGQPLGPPPQSKAFHSGSGS